MPDDRKTAPDRLPSIAHTGIESIRRSLGLGDSEMAQIHQAKARLSGEIEHWVDAFYRRHLTDPEAAPLLADEGRVIRLKRSLVAWFYELFSLPYDGAYERARVGIGLTHVRIRMPQHLMVTAMGTLRTDIFRSIHRVYGDDPGRKHVAHCLSLALDMELALMLNSYRREELAESRRHDRTMYTEHALQRFRRLLKNRVDRAICLVELTASNDAEAANGARVGLADAMRDLARMDHEIAPSSRAPASLGASALCASVTADVRSRPDVDVRTGVHPKELVVRAFETPLRLALEEVLQDAVSAVDNEVMLQVSLEPQGAVRFEVRGVGRRWVDRVSRYLGADQGDVGRSLVAYVAGLHGGTFGGAVDAGDMGRIWLDVPA